MIYSIPIFHSAEILSEGNIVYGYVSWTSFDRNSRDGPFTFTYSTQKQKNNTDFRINNYKRSHKKRNKWARKNKLSLASAGK